MSYRAQYNSQKAKAKKRGIAWEMTYAEWLAVWESSGRLPERGTGVGRYAMGRYGDTGPYKVGNVKILETVDNTLEYRAACRYAAGPRRLAGSRFRDVNFSEGRIDMMDPLQILELMEELTEPPKGTKLATQGKVRLR